MKVQPSLSHLQIRPVDWQAANNLGRIEQPGNWQQKKKQQHYGPFLWMCFNCLKARATLSTQFRLDGYVFFFFLYCWLLPVLFYILFHSKTYLDFMFLVMFSCLFGHFYTILLEVPLHILYYHQQILFPTFFIFWWYLCQN